MIFVQAADLLAVKIDFHDNYRVKHVVWRHVIPRLADHPRMEMPLHIYRQEVLLYMYLMTHNIHNIVDKLKSHLSQPMWKN